MATYVIGDVHGCMDAFKLLLEKIKFNKKQDVLWFTGDVINGSDSIDNNKKILQFIKELGEKNIYILGNHDLYFLRVAVNVGDDDPLLLWLRQRPLLYYDKKFNTILVHAGLHPLWGKKLALSLANEVEIMLQGEQFKDFLANMLGDIPLRWDDNLTGWDRLRCIVNYFTRMRFCSVDGNLDLQAKGPCNTAPYNMYPWYAVPGMKERDFRIIFGHWAALLGKTNNSKVIAMDTGCFWGHYLSALRLDDNYLFQVSCDHLRGRSK